MRDAEGAAAGRTSLGELARLFFRLGTTAFGGPAAHVSMMHVEVVTRRKWLSEERFLDLLGATNLIPGPNSTELAIHIGWDRRRGPGLLVAGLSFVLPAVAITAACSWAYVRFGTLPAAAWLLYGVKPVMIAVVLQAIWSLAPKAAKTFELRALGATTALLTWFGVHELLTLFGAGFVMVAIGSAPTRDRLSGLAPVLPPLGSAAALQGVTLPGLFWIFAKTGSVLFGSGYVLLAFLRADLVERLGWLSEAQLVDAIAIGQLTPGPVFTTATFIGYVLAGPWGAVVATVGIFLPAFVFVALSGPLVPRLRRSGAASAFLDGVNVASLALMAVVTAQLGVAAIQDLVTLGIAVVAAAALIGLRVNTTWLVVGGAVAGYLARFVAG